MTIWILPLGSPDLLYINNDRFEIKKIDSLPVSNSMYQDYIRESVSGSKDEFYCEGYSFALGDFIASVLYQKKI